MDDDIKEEHESFGMLQISRQSCNPPMNLFGSSITHSHLIHLSISRGEKHRNLHKDWYFGRESLIDIVMSETQFAEAITSLNMGSGVPVTLERVNNKRIDPCPEVNKRKESEQEFKTRCANISNMTKQAAKEATDLLSGSGVLKKEDRKRLSDLIYTIQMNIEQNLPFVNTSFNRQIEKTIMEAKGECEAFFTTAVHKLGIEALNTKSPQLIGYEKKEENKNG